MYSRRNFLGKMTASTPLIPLTPLPTLGNHETITDLTQLDRAISDSDYWDTLHNMSSLKKGQAYFNNGTMGPVPDYTLNRVIDDLCNNAVFAADS